MFNLTIKSEQLIKLFGNQRNELFLLELFLIKLKLAKFSFTSLNGFFEFGANSFSVSLILYLLKAVLYQCYIDLIKLDIKIIKNSKIA